MLRTIRALGLGVLLALASSSARADTITTEIASMLTMDASLPMGPGIALELADNLMLAQAASSYAASEPDSLTLSFAAVLRAIELEGELFGQTGIYSAQAQPLPFEQSQIAIDDRANVQFSINGQVIEPGTVIDFGKVDIPEPSTIGLLLAGLAIVGMLSRIRLTK